MYCEDFLVDKENGDFDTFGIFYALKEENSEQKRIEINRFFREPCNGEKESEEFPGWVEISKEEYVKCLKTIWNHEELFGDFDETDEETNKEE